MARYQRRDEPVSSEEYEEMNERIEAHFDRVRGLLDEALGTDEN